MRAFGLSWRTRCRVCQTPPTAPGGRPASSGGSGGRWRRGGRRPGARAGAGRARPAAQLAVVGDARGRAAAAPAGRPGRGAARRAAGACATGTGGLLRTHSCECALGLRALPHSVQAQPARPVQQSLSRLPGLLLGLVAGLPCPLITAYILLLPVHAGARRLLCRHHMGVNTAGS
jgi:hypothetical protein